MDKFAKTLLSQGDELTVLERCDSEEQRITTRNVMDKLFATHNEQTWKDGLRKNAYEPSYVSTEA